MATRSMRFCSYPGCNELVKSGRCEKHQTNYDSNRKNVRERGYSSQWDKVSKRHKQLHPLCEECLKEDYITPTQISHHIIPEQLCKQIGRDDLIYDMDNLKADCIPCHGKETAIDRLWFTFAETDSMKGTAKEIMERFGSRYPRGV